jgi:excisionase family DNA binding protein
MAQQTTAIDSLRTIGVPELATILGCSQAHIYRLSSERRDLPPMVKIGQLVRFRISDVEKWLESQVVTLATAEPQKNLVKRGRGRPRKARHG